MFEERTGASVEGGGEKNDKRKEREGVGGGGGQTLTCLFVLPYKNPHRCRLE